ncbi:hypothetical protein K0M31_015184 [Melipona bicolor]|uniref:Uncharacterized protein n=1 Tax=Melipona bicolor TaxID=60889 RepID=A0AA40FGA7_9HYME|nr:hypothetical protein K0M31_015184 [Melipona bicolor]
MLLVRDWYFIFRNTQSHLTSGSSRVQLTILHLSLSVEETWCHALYHSHACCERTQCKVTSDF